MASRKYFLLLLLSISLTLEFNQAFADYKSDAAAINSSANPSGSLNASTAQNVVPNYNTNAPQSNYYSNPAAMNDDSHNAAQSGDAGKVATSSFNNKGDYNLAYLPKDNSSNIDVSSVIKLFTGSYSDCQPTTTSTPGLNTTNTCDQYYQVAQNSCQIVRNIQVSSTFTYSCTKVLTYTTKNCTQNLNVTATPGTLTSKDFTKGWAFSSLGVSGNMLTIGASYHVCFFPVLSSGEQIYLNLPYNPALSGIYTVNRSECSCSGGVYSLCNTLIYLNKSLGISGSYPGGIGIEPSTPAPIINSSWQEVCS